VEIVVVKHDRHAVPAEQDVELDAVGAGYRRFEGAEAVLDDSAPVEAAMRERRRAEARQLSLSQGTHESTTFVGSSD
jgi:hypothetical protein